ncbi:retrovirus-related Pol polyprotein from transposon 17.6 [Trichonephila inaurata madagascariensis]|uniref:Retrovirus-related Pol polyprotein from transposon 17.6 n=1 Tax=Trichonephila inaurata madagascariensis TaxID=2747483 RepID=A0A8X6X8E9_9ARAC|nr:retrovirus-related Pol polyprotein from transposon 17.6 [Trichonephila inaurata madagascariensis]
MLKPYHKRPELLNVVLVDTEEITEPSELKEDFPYMLTDPNVFDFREIVENNQLKERLGDEQIMQLGKLLVKFSAIFSNIPGKTNLVEHDIDLISDKRVQHKPYRMTNRQNEILKAEIERMLKYKIIEPGPSEYTSSMILVETPGRDPRPCIDYRKLNEMTRTELYPIPNIEQRFETVAAAKFITLIDLTKGYWQIPLSPKAQKIAAFATSFCDGNGKEHPILFLSKKFTATERKYSTTVKECAAILYAIKKLKGYIDGQTEFYIQTDHNPLVWLKNNAGNNGQLLRWALALQSFNFTVTHKKGKDNLNVDCLSRNSLHSD